MKKLVLAGVFGTSLLAFLAGCGTSASEVVSSDTEKINVVASISIIAEMVNRVGGDLVTVHSLVPVGDNPEDHEILPADVIAVSEADLIFYNGLGLEMGNGWFENLMNSADLVADVDFFAVTVGIDAYKLNTDGMADYYDPHAWLDLRNGIVYLENIARVLGEFKPDYREKFEQNAAQYSEELQALHDKWDGAFDHIPDDERIIVTTEGAFRYFASAYNLHTVYIWELNAHEEGSIEQMRSIVEAVNASNVRAIFTESSLTTQFMEQVELETGVPIFGMLYTDSLSAPDGSGATYLEMMRHNLETIYSGLTQER